MSDGLDWFWLCTLPGFYQPDLQKLLAYFGTPQDVREAPDAEVEKLTFFKEAKKQTLLLHKKRFQTENEYHKYVKRGISFISCEDERCPPGLMQIADPPYGLFVKGQLPQPGERTVAVVGARMCTNYGRTQARRLAERLAQCGVSLVSGMAYGIDASAQEACLEAGGKSYGVLGCGVDLCYPGEHRLLYQKLQECGGVISEYPPGTGAKPFHFPLRNRIISALSGLVVVVEAKAKSGSLITADLALEQGRDVYAFPGRVGDALSHGCNALIAQGAGILADIDAFLEGQGLCPPPLKKEQKTNIVLASAEKLVYSVLDSCPVTPEELAAKAGLPLWQTMSAVGALELRGLAAQTAKNHYVRKN